MRGSTNTMRSNTMRNKWGKREARLNYAITDAVICTIHEGRRVVRRYTSGQKLVGKIVAARTNML